MISSLRKALGQMDDPAFKRVFWRALLGALAVYLVLAFGTWLLLSRTTFFDNGWLEWAVHLLGGLAAFVLPLFLFPAMAGLIISVYVEEISRAVEARHYPDLPPPPGASVGQSMRAALRFTAVALGLNLVALVLVYWIPVINVIVFVLLNGWLLGREYFEAVGLRRADLAEVSALRLASRTRLWFAGAVVALLSGIPVLNLAAPVIGTALFVHEFEALRRRRGVQRVA